jgi:hypothetical protein
MLTYRKLKVKRINTSETEGLIPDMKYSLEVHFIIIALSLHVKTTFAVQVYKKTRNSGILLFLSYYVLARSGSECCVAESYFGLGFCTPLSLLIKVSRCSVLRLPRIITIVCLINTYL